MQDAQDEIIAFLRRPDSYGLAEGTVETVETHISIVFLAGECAYKLKRAVKYPYLDFSTPELRRAACEAELTLNRRTAPQLYLEIRAIGRRAGCGRRRPARRIAGRSRSRAGRCRRGSGHPETRPVRPSAAVHDLWDSPLVAVILPTALPKTTQMG